MKQGGGEMSRGSARRRPSTIEEWRTPDFLGCVRERAKIIGHAVDRGSTKQQLIIESIFERLYCTTVGQELG